MLGFVLCSETLCHALKIFIDIEKTLVNLRLMRNFVLSFTLICNLYWWFNLQFHYFLENVIALLFNIQSAQLFKLVWLIIWFSLFQNRIIFIAFLTWDLPHREWNSKKIDSLLQALHIYWRGEMFVTMETLYFCANTYNSE